MSADNQGLASGTSTPKDGSLPPQKKKFHNGWTPELENLFADWADKAACYRWMHEKTERIYHKKDQGFMFPIIILSTVTGAANFALNSVISDTTMKNYAQLGLGGLSILTGILTTIANRLGYSSGSEAHRLISTSWGKFNRLIVIELSLHPDERMESFAFMKMFRTELDRLIEQSPSIPDYVISAFMTEFKTTIDIKKPEIVGQIEHTRVFTSTNERLKKIAQEAALTIAQKKGVLKQLVLDDLDIKMRRMADESARGAIEKHKAETEIVRRIPPMPLKHSVEQHKVDRAAELHRVSQASVVASVKQQFQRNGIQVAPPILSSARAEMSQPSIGLRGRDLSSRRTSTKAESVRSIPVAITTIPENVIVLPEQAQLQTNTETHFVIDFDGSSPPPPIPALPPSAPASVAGSVGRQSVAGSVTGQVVEQPQVDPQEETANSDAESTS